MQHPTPPSVEPSLLRPRRRWYVVAAVIGVVLVLAGIGGFAFGIAAAINEGGLADRFATGKTVTVRLAPDDRSAIYVAESGRIATSEVECRITSTGGETVGLSSPPFSFTYTRSGTTWHLRYVIDVRAEGQYRVSCRPTSVDAAATLAIGKAPDAARFFGGLFGGLAVLFVLPTAGLLIGATIAVVVGVKRAGHRRRLQAERAGFPQQRPTNRQAPPPPR